jgi:hypothetical protein
MDDAWSVDLTLTFNICDMKRWTGALPVQLHLQVRDVNRIKERLNVTSNMSSTVCLCRCTVPIRAQYTNYELHMRHTGCGEVWHTNGTLAVLYAGGCVSNSMHVRWVRLYVLRPMDRIVACLVQGQH